MSPTIKLRGAMSWFVHLEKFILNFSNLLFEVCVNLLHPLLIILIPPWFIIIFLVFLYLLKHYFLGFLQFNGGFVCGQGNSKYCDSSFNLATLLTVIYQFNQCIQ